ncbi:hypothetical protein HanXRQr2_Chr04g0182231 [Helianthus annuus]|uniref:Uncharacterized protein n=1 Tax=Helianthus annuus TaxID=4232 RepID=A0A251V0X1_HELAN|nr:hypothetical protein HanXRQr2_Chr04g0182231 [Helianthus annuus]KAJ0582156.1 hypothetical protein HanHA300_Chr04g0149131 [Helianthus annuus]KAJ0598140.1 hypothetical protein HanHA89_Chr04g0162511 [Helianthus annuus]KAJ0932621.1 hypothetical protein HanPSC8_Chr04g0175721 [Helianthus annuus]
MWVDTGSVSYYYDPTVYVSFCKTLDLNSPSRVLLLSLHLAPNLVSPSSIQSSILHLEGLVVVALQTVVPEVAQVIMLAVVLDGVWMSNKHIVEEAAVQCKIWGLFYCIAT